MVVLLQNSKGVPLLHGLFNQEDKTKHTEEPPGDIHHGSRISDV